MQLTPELAHPIVNRAMAILQRNVNIMDAQGVIVASGDLSRIGDYHEASAAVLRTGRRVEIGPEDVDRWGGVRVGVNLALRLDDRIVGVVGITGPPNEVRPFGEVIREMVQLMLAQVHSAEVERTAALFREAVLRDLLTGTGDLPERLVREALLIGLRSGAAYQVLLCEPPRTAGPGDYAWLDALTARAEAISRELGVTSMFTGPWEGRLVIISSELPDVLATRLGAALGEGTALSSGLIGSGLLGLRRSYQTAVLAMDAGRRLWGWGLFLASAMRLETMLATIAPQGAVAFLEAVVGRLPPADSRPGRLFRETLEAYARSGMSAAATSVALSIHRHTLSYRLEQIAESTGLDPRTWDGALHLYLGLQIERFFGQNGQFGA